MGKFIKKFDTHTEYEAYMGGSVILPNVSYCEDDKDVHYNPIVPPSRVITAVFNIPTTANPISLTYENGWSDIESVVVTSPNGSTFELSYSDLVEYDSMEGIDPFMAYQFDATGNYTFEYTLKPNVDRIDGDLFTSIPYITSVEIPNSVASVGTYVFQGCSGLTSVTIPNSVTSIGNGAFQGCSGLTSITIPNSVTSIGSDAFSECTSLTSITIPNSVTSIGNEAFGRCKSLTSIIVDSGNSVYDSRNNCNAIIQTATNTLIQGSNNTVIPNSVTSIGEYAFQQCSGLTSIIIPSSVTSIDNGAFSYCSGLTSVTIGSGVTSIGDNAFNGCSSLTSVTVEAITPPTLGSQAFYNANNCPIYVPSQSVSTYKSAYGWNTYASRIQAMP